MILVDTSVWIDFLGGSRSSHRKLLHALRSTIDCMIAVVALENGVALLAKDRDFQSIAEVEPLVLVAV
ncbi:MAG: PIN domain-containing protein [bacterium]